MAGIWLDDTELDALERADGVAVKVYLTIRRRMDREDFTAGLRTALSWNALRERAAHEVRRGAGVQEVSPHVSKVRREAANLERLGLVKPRGNGEVIVFSCPMAKAADARSKQTRQGSDRVYAQAGGYARYSSKCLNREDILMRCGVDSGAGEAAMDAPNPAYIKSQGFYPSQSSSKAETKVGAGDARRGARGVNRDRPAGSQAGPLGQAGNTYAGDRDRAAPSHDGRGAPVLGVDRARPVGEEAVGVVAGPVVPSAGLLAGGSGGGLAAGDALAGERCHAGALADALKAVVVGANVRVPVGSGVFSAWAADGVTVEVMRIAVDRAFSARKKAGSVQPVPLGYLASCVSSVLEELRQARDVVACGPGKRMSAKGAQDRLLMLARSMGMDARPGEDWPALQARVYAAVERAGCGAA